jgi:hypothetical protein
MAGLGNLVNGVGIFTGATFNTVGGTTAAARNVLSGNTLSGVVMSDPGTANNVVAGNYIGTNVAGNGAIPNAREACSLGSAANNRIGTNETAG